MNTSKITLNDKNVGRRIQLARKAVGYSCLEVADKCYINVGYVISSSD